MLLYLDGKKNMKLMIMEEYYELMMELEYQILTIILPALMSQDRIDLNGILLD